MPTPQHLHSLALQWRISTGDPWLHPECELMEVIGCAPPVYKLDADLLQVEVCPIGWAQGAQWLDTGQTMCDSHCVGCTQREHRSSYVRPGGFWYITGTRGYERGDLLYRGWVRPLIHHTGDTRDVQSLTRASIAQWGDRSMQCMAGMPRPQDPQHVTTHQTHQRLARLTKCFRNPLPDLWGDL